MNAERPRGVHTDLPGDTDPAIVAAFRAAEADIRGRLEEIDAEFDARLATLRATHRARRRRALTYLGVQMVGIVLCLVAVFADRPWLYWTGYTLIIASLVCSWWAEGYFHKLFAWLRRTVGR